MEVHALRRTAKTVLETYLGRLTGERVLNGLIHRGDGEDIHAVLWLCDLRGSTTLADKLPRRAFLELLNDYFECMAGAVLAHRGEVLKFIGDAMLAIFPIGAITDHPERCPEHARACADAIAAAREAIRRMAELNLRRRERREQPLRFGIALHLGDVMFGNVGAPGRLDFTVIGPAVNEAARLEAMCKTLSQPLVISAEVARLLCRSRSSRSACTRSAASAGGTNCSRWRRSRNRRALSLRPLYVVGCGRGSSRLVCFGSPTGDWG